MAALRSPNGSVIQASGRLEERLLAAGWVATDQPPSPGLHLITVAELDQLATTVSNAVAASAADRADLRQILEPIADQVPEVQAEVDDLNQTIAATSAGTAAKPTPRTDALEAWRGEAEPVIDGLHPVATSGDYSVLANRPAIPAVGTTAGTVAAGNDPRLSDARTPTAHTHPAAQVTGLHAVATSGAYGDLTGKPALNFDPAGSASTAQAAAVQRANHTGTQPAATVTGLHAVATSGDYNALANKPTIPAAVVARQAVVNTGALTANTVKNVSVTWPTAMPSATYAIAATPVSTAPNTLNTSIVSQTAAGCVIAIRSTAAVGGGLNLHCIALA